MSLVLLVMSDIHDEPLRSLEYVCVWVCDLYCLCASARDLSSRDLFSRGLPSAVYTV